MGELIYVIALALGLGFILFCKWIIIKYDGLTERRFRIDEEQPLEHDILMLYIDKSSIYGHDSRFMSITIEDYAKLVDQLAGTRNTGIINEALKSHEFIPQTLEEIEYVKECAMAFSKYMAVYEPTELDILDKMNEYEIFLNDLTTNLMATMNNTNIGESLLQESLDSVNNIRSIVNEVECEVTTQQAEEILELSQKAVQDGSGDSVAEQGFETCPVIEDVAEQGFETCPVIEDVAEQVCQSCTEKFNFHEALYRTDEILAQIIDDALLYFAEFPFNQNTLNYEEIMHVFHIDPMKFYLCMRDAGRGMYFLYYHHNLFTFSPMLYYWMYMLEMIFIVFFCFVMWWGLTSKENNLYEYKNYLKIIIGGLGLQIFFLIHGNVLGAHVTNVLGGKYALAFNLNSLMYGNVVFAMRIFICFFAICFFFEMLTSAKYEETIDYAFPLMILINIFGLWWMVSVNDYFLMFLILEIQSISLYVLVALKNSNLSKEAALKYFFYGSFASGILVIGVSLIYGAMGTTNLTDINLLLGAAYNSIPLMFFLGVIFVLVGLFFKLGIAPFHSWVYDIYGGASMRMVYFFATISKISLIFIFYRIFGIFLNPLIHTSWLVVSTYDIYRFGFLSIIMGCAVASIIIGAFGAYNEPSLQRFLGFSSISNMGFILASLSLGTYDGLYAAIYYFFVYLLTMLLVFAILFVLRKDKDFSLIKNITDLSTISHGSPWLSMSLGCALFSLAGIPPFGGFFGKFAIIIAYLNSANFLVALCLLLLSVWIPIYYIS